MKIELTDNEYFFVVDGLRQYAKYQRELAAVYGEASAFLKDALIQSAEKNEKLAQKIEDAP
jgi:hypothetical protein